MKKYKSGKIGNIIICGAPRAGTTSVFRYLSSHQDIAPSYKKELSYFLGGTINKDSFNYTSQCFDKYIENFSKIDDKIWTIEASPAYMHPCYLEKVVLRIKELNPAVRLIMLIRNPIDRLYSEYQGRKERQDKFPKEFSFNDFINMLLQNDKPSNYGIDQEASHLVAESLMVSAYVNTIDKYLQYFDARQLKLIFTESLADNPEKVMLDVCEWLNIPSDIYNNYSFHIENKMVIANNKRLYRIALWLNSLLDPMLGKMPGVRKSLRDIHNIINVTSKIRSDVMLDASSMAVINEYFAPYNSKLAVLIQSRWPEIDMPEWLDN